MAQDDPYFLVSDFDFSTIGKEDSLLLDSALTIYHSSSSDTLQLKALSILADNLYNGVLWPKYNQILYDHAVEAEKSAAVEVVKKEILKYQSTAINNFGYLEYNKGNTDKSLEFYELSNAKQKEIGYVLGYTHSLNNLGALYYSTGKLDSALSKYNECVPLQKELKDYENLVQTLNNLAVVYREIGQVAISAQYHMEALEYCNLISDATELAETYAYLGELYLRNDNLELSYKYFSQGLEIQSKNNYSEGEAFALSNLGKLFLAFDSIDIAKEYFLKSDSIFEIIDHQHGRGGININLGKIAKKTGDIELALYYYRKSLSIRKHMKDIIGEASCYSHLGVLYHENNMMDSAIYYCERSLELARGFSDFHLIRQNSHVLYQIFKGENDVFKALQYYEEYHAAQDTLQAEENMESLYDLQYKEQYYAKTFNDSLTHLKKELESKEMITKQELELDKQNNRIFYLSIVGFFLLLLVAIALRAYRKKKEANQIITEQKKLVEEKNHQITESISYAQKIQEALLKEEDELHHYFSEYRLFFQPRDIVSGDFYWWKRQNNFVYIAVGDCTGHGVPGALMSGLSLSYLEEIVLNKASLLPHEILEDLRHKIISGLSQTAGNDGVKDGLDISLLRLDLDTFMVDWAGANNEIYLLTDRETEFDHAERYTTDPINLWVGTPTDQHVGYNHNTWDFETRRFQLHKGDWIYLFSDGYLDQFGGEQGKKLKHKRFKQIILKSRQNNTVLSSEFNSWKGDYESIDDVCVLGFKI